MFLMTVGLVVLMPSLVYAVPLTSPNYKLDPQGLNSFGGQGSSSNYRMVSSGGEAVVGNGSGGSYKLSSGYVSQLQQSIELSLTESLNYEKRNFYLLFGTEDKAEGMKAFVDKRKAEWKNR